MIAFVYRKDLKPGKIRVWMAESMNAASKLPGLPMYKRGKDMCVFRPTPSRVIIHEEPHGTCECVSARVLREVRLKWPLAELKTDASFERRIWNVYIVIPDSVAAHA